MARLRRAGAYKIAIFTEPPQRREQCRVLLGQALLDIGVEQAENLLAVAVRADDVGVPVRGAAADVNRARR
jgi:hypothetical protein